MTACVCVQQDVVVGQQDMGCGGGGAAQQRSAQLGGKTRTKQTLLEALEAPQRGL